MTKLLSLAALVCTLSACTGGPTEEPDVINTTVDIHLGEPDVAVNPLTVPIVTSAVTGQTVWTTQPSGRPSPQSEISVAIVWEMEEGARYRLIQDDEIFVDPITSPFEYSYTVFGRLENQTVDTVPDVRIAAYSEQAPMVEYLSERVNTLP